jgi:hypothetical protein
MDTYDTGKARNFMVGNEPDKNAYPTSHDAWNDLRKGNKFNYLPLDDIEQIKDYAIAHGVQPLFTKQTV